MGGFCIGLVLARRGSVTNGDTPSSFYISLNINVVFFSGNVGGKQLSKEVEHGKQNYLFVGYWSKPN